MVLTNTKYNVGWFILCNRLYNFGVLKLQNNPPLRFQNSRLFISSLLISNTVVRLYSKDFGIGRVVIQLKVQKFSIYLVASERPFLDT